MAWDVEFIVGTIIALAVGNAIGFFIGLRMLRATIFELLSHPAVQKLVSLADKVPNLGRKRGGIMGMIGDALELGTAITRPPIQP